MGGFQTLFHNAAMRETSDDRSAINISDQHAEICLQRLMYERPHSMVKPTSSTPCGRWAVSCATYRRILECSYAYLEVDAGCHME